MTAKECSLTQELLPLYAEGLVCEETAEYIEEHLTGCRCCTQVWENFKQPVPDPLSTTMELPRNDVENKVIARVKASAVIALLLLVMSGAGLAYASYYAGKHVGIDDPVYRFAKELDLFTEINQTKSAGSLSATIDKGLFDSTRSILFIHLSAPGKVIPQVSLSDENGNQYEEKRGKGWQNKYFMLEFEPLKLDAQNVSVSLGVSEKEDEMIEFSFPVDILKTAQYTTVIYPNQKKEQSNLNISLEKAVLGVSETQFRVQFDWPTEGSVAGIALGRGEAYFPTSVRKAPAIPPPPGLGPLPPGGLSSGYAATYGINYRAQELPENRPALYDLTARQEIEVQGGEYRTTQFPCQVEAILKFAPVNREIEQMELLLPPVYLYEKVKTSDKLTLDFKEASAVDLQQTISYGEGRLVIEKAWTEKDKVSLSYRLEPADDNRTILPHFEIIDTEGKKQGQMRFERENPQVITFYLFNDGAGEFFLDLDSIGRLLPRENFTLDMND